ncbi:MAG: DUF2142 domain-containing protein [Deltaproteobacteria bacterium]|nr:DUF2142 domain-containing protein [Deltaproteobacteria bacterium]
MLLKRFFEYPIAFIVCWAVLSLWTVIKPPFQTSDEFSHYAKALSISQGLITPAFEFPVKKADINPLLVALDLHFIPFGANVKIGWDRLRMLKNAVWPYPSHDGLMPIESTAYTYPYPLYALVYYGGQGITDHFKLSPYDSHYTYRLVAAFFAALLWVFFLFLLGRSPFAESKYFLWVFCVFNPVVSFMSGSINPDSILLPAAAIAMISVYMALLQNRYMLLACFALTLTALVKRPGLFMVVIVPAMAAGICWHSSRRVETFKALLPKTLLLTFMPVMLSYALYYAYAPGALDSEKTFHAADVGILGYLAMQWARTGSIAVGFWGSLGWTDYGLPHWAVAFAYLVVLLNLVMFLKDKSKDNSRQLAIVLFYAFIAHLAVLYLMEIYYVKIVGFLLQGRYFLPAVLGVAVLLLHDRRWLRYVTMFMLFAFHVYLLEATVERYYDGNWRLAYKSRPYVAYPLKKKEKLNLPLAEFGLKKAP